jgi:DNA-binding NarL/FixJ family response regulator
LIDDDSGLDTGRIRIVVTAVLVLVAVGAGVDLYLDEPADWFTPHVVVELLLVAASLGVIIWLWRGWDRAAVGLTNARASLADREKERDAWRGRAESSLLGLGYAIDEQFSAWGLTPSEREVALLLLKGLGHKQVAGATDRSERTVRQHAVSVYQKSGLSGRAELSAFFLEGLLLPRDQRPD